MITCPAHRWKQVENKMQICKHSAVVVDAANDASTSAPCGQSVLVKCCPHPVDNMRKACS